MLNLYRISKRMADDPDHAARPLFATPLLNRCIILKHRLRPSEQALFDTPYASATKIILPIDQGDLRSGGQSVFVGERAYDEMMREAFGPALQAGSRDRVTLELIDALPSLDPFILREHLKGNGVTAAPCYFEISDADLQRMFAFVQDKIQALVSMSFGDASGFAAHTAKLVRKILATDGDNDLGPLRQTLRLEQHEYEEGMFCWKGFLYYQWVLSELYPQSLKVGSEIGAIRPRGPQDADTRAYISAARGRLWDKLGLACDAVKATLDIYDRAYAGLTSRADPGAFRDFLLSAPAMFSELGERLGVVQHIVTFWRFRFPPGSPQLVTPDELAEIFGEFEDGLSVMDKVDPPWRASAALQV